MSEEHVPLNASNDTLEALVRQYSPRGPDNPGDIDILDVVYELRYLREENKRLKDLNPDGVQLVRLRK